MKKGANAPESVLFKRVIKKRQKRANKQMAPKFKWVNAPKVKPSGPKKPGILSRFWGWIKSLVKK